MEESGPLFNIGSHAINYNLSLGANNKADNVSEIEILQTHGVETSQKCVGNESDITIINSKSNATDIETVTMNYKDTSKFDNASTPDIDNSGVLPPNKDCDDEVHFIGNVKNDTHIVKSSIQNVQLIDVDKNDSPIEGSIIKVDEGIQLIDNVKNNLPGIINLSFVNDNGEVLPKTSEDAKCVEKEVIDISQPLFVHDFGRKESSDSESDSESDSSTSESVVSVASRTSSESVVVKSSNNVKLNAKPKEKQGQLNPFKTPGELGLHDLPPIEDLYITVPEKDCHHIGKVSSIVFTQVIIQSFENERPLDLDTVLFLKDGNSLGTIFDVFGRVAAPFYSIRFNSKEDIQTKGIEVGCDVYCAPTHKEVTNFVFTEKLLMQKGSDASWKDNNEPPDECLEFSDDEQERMHKMKLKAKRKNPTGEEVDIEIVHSNVNNQKSKFKNKRNSGPVVRPNRFSAPTPDLNSMNGQQSSQNWPNLYQGQHPQNSNSHWSNAPQFQNFQNNPLGMGNPFTFGAPPMFFNNTFAMNQNTFAMNPFFNPMGNSNTQLGQSRFGMQPLVPQFGPVFGSQPLRPNPFMQGQPFASPSPQQLMSFCLSRPPPPPPSS